MWQLGHTCEGSNSGCCFLAFSVFCRFAAWPAGGGRSGQGESGQPSWYQRARRDAHSSGSSSGSSSSSRKGCTLCSEQQQEKLQPVQRAAADSLFGANSSSLATSCSSELAGRHEQHPAHRLLLSQTPLCLPPQGRGAAPLQCQTGPPPRPCCSSGKGRVQEASSTSASSRETAAFADQGRLQTASLRQASAKRPLPVEHVVLLIEAVRRQVGILHVPRPVVAQPCSRRVCAATQGGLWQPAATMAGAASASSSGSSA